MIFRTEHLKVMPVDISGFLSSQKYIIDNINNSGYLSFFAIVSSPSTTTFTDVLFSAFVSFFVSKQVPPLRHGLESQAWERMAQLNEHETIRHR